MSDDGILSYLISTLDKDEDKKHPNHQRFTAIAFMPIYNNIRRNADCPCGSTKKFKRCCINKSLSQS